MSEQEITNDISKTYGILREFINDILTTFPEYNEKITKGVLDIKEESYDTSEASSVIEHCRDVYLMNTVDIMSKNNTIFNSNENNSTEFIPGIHFSDLWTQNISDNTRDIIWKYLQLVLYSLLPKDNYKNFFEKSSELFNKIDGKEQQINELFTQIGGTDELFKKFTTLNVDISNITENYEDIDTEEYAKNLEGIFGGKIGNLAKDIAQEISSELDINDTDGDINSVGDVLQKMIGNPAQILKITQSITGKMDEKLKSGEINQEDILQEAGDIMNNMGKLPGMKEAQKIFSSMGMNMPFGKGGGGGSAGAMGGFHNKMQQAMSQNKQRERMLAKLAKRREHTQNEAFGGMQIVETTEPPTNTVIQQTGDNEFIFRSGDKPEKSSRSSQKPKHGKKKKKGRK